MFTILSFQLHELYPDFDFEFYKEIYPDLKARKLFVHDAWEIAKFTENFELKMIII
jgi:hypothetical protein